MDNDVVKNTNYHKLLIKFNVIDNRIPRTSGSVTKIEFDSDKKDLHKKIEDFDEKIPNTSGLVNILIMTQKLQRLKTRYLVLMV